MPNSAFNGVFGKDGPPTTTDTTPIHPTDKRMRGKITKLADEEGWGFIASREIKFTRIFFHWSALRQDTLNFTELKTGMTVEFTPVRTDGKGFRAMKIQVIPDEQPKQQPEEGSKSETSS